jgi:hypothetical protein
MFIQDVQKQDLSTITGYILYKIITSYMIPVLCSQTIAAAIRQPKPALVYLFFRQFQAFLTPDTFHSFIVGQDSFISKHIGNHPTLNPTVISSQPNNRCTDLVFIALTL